MNDSCRIQNDGHAERVDFDAVSWAGSTNLLSLNHVVEWVGPVLHQDEGRAHLLSLRYFSLNFLVALDKSFEIRNLRPRFLHLPALFLNAVPLLTQKLLILVDLRL